MTTSRAIKGTRESEVGRVILVSRASEGLHLLSGTVCAITHIMIVQVALDRGLSDEAFCGRSKYQIQNCNPPLEFGTRGERHEIRISHPSNRSTSSLTTR